MTLGTIKMKSLLVLGILFTTCIIPVMSGMQIDYGCKAIDILNFSNNKINNDNSRIFDLMNVNTFYKNIINQNPLKFNEKLYINTGMSICETNDNGFVCVGSTGSIDTSENTGDSNILLIKTDQNGEEEWMNTFHGGGISEGWSVEQTTDSGYIISGPSFSSSSISALLIKTDSNGNQEWSKKYTVSDLALSTRAIQTSDGGYLLTGEALSMANPEVVSLFVLKANNMGDLEWSKTFTEKDANVGYNLIETRDHNYIIVGYTADYTSSFLVENCDVLIAKLNSEGNEIFCKSIDFENDDICNDICQTNGDDFIITGVCNTLTGPDLFIVKINDNGEVQWENIFNDKVGRSICQTDDNGFVIGGYEGGCSSGSCLPSSAIILKVSEQGQQEWEKSYKGIEQAVCNELDKTNDFGYIMTGVTICSNYDTFSQVLMLKTDENGDMVWENTYFKKMPETEITIDIGNNGVTIENIGEIFAKDLTVTIEIKGGVLGRINTEETFEIEEFMEEEKETFPYPKIFGIGSIDIIVKLNAYNVKFESKTAYGTLFLWFLHVKN